ncbi:MULTISPECIES: ABC transporter substrate-binding protein [Paenibacillus]|uniref:ABC transporter substrate-binding protein n=1 Tax=Paenibacillus TaxID=44249 RepID=UPI00043299BF|nr:MULTISPECIES: extracellular solute-binding protein [Paenibacillus]KKC46067.1 ABC transporter substrate-binding protein [Paenibacillus sp. D9]CDN45740.1 Lactose-binding protein [Paenibacillus sp. P22]
MKKATLLLAMALLLILSACSSDSGSGNSSSANKGGTEPSGGSSSKEITIWAWDKNFNIKALELAKELYAKDHPDTKITVIENAQADIVQKLNTGFGSGSNKGLPNIVLIEDYRAQSFLQAFPDMFFDLTSSIKGSDFAQYKIGPTSVDGKNYGLPFDSGVTGLFVRTDYLEKAGYKTSDLQNITWDQYIEIGKKVKEATGKNMLALDPNDLGIVRTMIQTAGSWYMDKDGKKPYLEGNPALKEAFQLYKTMIEDNMVKPVSDWSQYLAAFNSGDVASVPTGNWISASIKSQGDQSGKWAVVPIPRLSGQSGAVNASNLGGSSWYVLNVPGKEAAADFMAKTFGSSTELYQKLITDIGAIGTYAPAASGEAYSQADPFYNNQTVIADFANWTNQIPRVNYGASTYAIEDILIVEMQNFLSGKSIDAVLKDAQQQAEAQTQ